MLNIYCSGAGGPAVILESGATWPFYNTPKAMWEKGAPRPGYSWVLIQRELDTVTTACWYDRAGSGWSDSGPYPRDSASQARDLHALLEGARVPPPYVLVAESSAALDAHVYAGLYPAEVAGLVLVDGVHPDLLKLARPEPIRRSQDIVAPVFNEIGLYRFLTNRLAPAPPTPKGITSTEWNTIWRLSQAPKARTALLQEMDSWEESTAQARAAGSLGDHPLIVISSESARVAPKQPRLWVETQTDLARLSTRGKNIVVDEGDDLIYQAPDAIIEAVRQVLAEVRYQPRGLR